jgi:hypothetical protein
MGNGLLTKKRAPLIYTPINLSDLGHVEAVLPDAAIWSSYIEQRHTDLGEVGTAKWLATVSQKIVAGLPGFGMWQSAVQVGDASIAYSLLLLIIAGCSRSRYQSMVDTIV